MFSACLFHFVSRIFTAWCWQCNVRYEDLEEWKLESKFWTEHRWTHVNSLRKNAQLDILVDRTSSRHKTEAIGHFKISKNITVCTICTVYAFCSFARPATKTCAVMQKRCACCVASRCCTGSCPPCLADAAICQYLVAKLHGAQKRLTVKRWSGEIGERFALSHSECECFCYFLVTGSMRNIL